MLPLKGHEDGVNKHEFTEFAIHHAGIHVAEKLMDCIFEEASAWHEQKGKEGADLEHEHITIDYAHLRQYLCHVHAKAGKTTNIYSKCDVAVVSTALYLCGGALFMVLGAASLIKTIMAGDEVSVTMILGMIASITYCAGGVGFQKMTVHAEQVSHHVHRDRQLLFYSQMVAAGKQLVEPHKNLVVRGGMHAITGGMRIGAAGAHALTSGLTSGAHVLTGGAQALTGAMANGTTFAARGAARPDPFKPRASLATDPAAGQVSECEQAANSKVFV